MDQRDHTAPSRRRTTALRFPRAQAILEALALAELLKQAARDLESLPADFEPATLRRRAHGIIRGAVSELEGRVSL